MQHPTQIVEPKFWCTDADRQYKACRLIGIGLMFTIIGFLPGAALIAWSRSRYEQHKAWEVQQ